MRRGPLHPRSWLVPASLALAIAGCSSTTEIGSYSLTYRARLSGLATIDSVLYDNGTGTMVKSTASPNFVVTVTAYPGSTVEAHLFGTGTAAGTAQMAVVWMPVTGEITGDSTTTATVTATKFTLTLAHRQL